MLSFSICSKYALESSKSDYYCFCDQDDVWFENKIEISLREIKKLEKEHPKQFPLMVFSDLLPVDSKFKHLSDSFYTISRMNPSKNINHLILHNFVVGCTMIFNRKLLDISHKIPRCERMHDSWLALVAFACGETFYINKPLILYRQHNKNVFGVSNSTSLKVLLNKISTINDKFNYVCKRSQALINVKNINLHKDLETSINRYASLNKISLIKRIVWMMRYRMFPQGILRNLSWGLILLIAKTKK